MVVTSKKTGPSGRWVIDHGSGAATRCCDPMRLTRRRAQIGLACRVIGWRCARPGAQPTSPDQEASVTRSLCKYGEARNNFRQKLWRRGLPNRRAALCMLCRREDRQ